MSKNEATAVAPAIDQLYRQCAGQLIAACTSYFGMLNLATAEDLVQDTFASALASWQVKGLPDDPRSWLFKVCKHKALNLISKEQVTKRQYLSRPTSHSIDDFFLPHEIDDQQLRLLIASTIRDFSPRMRMIFILRAIHGVRSKAVAKLLLMTDGAVQKTYERAVQRIKKETLLTRMPDSHESIMRLPDVVNALYLIYVLGYDKPWQQDTGDDLCYDALRLTRLLSLDLARHHHQLLAMYSLMLFHTARLSSRVTPEGAIVDLENQDRSMWDSNLIQLAIIQLNKAQHDRPPSKYHLEAAIASLHCTAPCFADTPWARIADLYQQLDQAFPSPFVKLNLAVSLLYAKGPEDALTYLKSYHFSAFSKNYQYHASLSKIYQAAGTRKQAIEHLQLAIQFAPTLPIRDHLQKKLPTLQSISDHSAIEVQKNQF